MIPAGSHHHLVAEAVAFPYWHDAALTRCVTALARAAPGAEPAHLARPLEQHLAGHAPGASLPQLARLRDLAWFDDGALAVPLATHLVRVASAHLELRGHRVGVRHDDALPWDAYVARWRELSLAMPSDLLVAALCAARRVEVPDEKVSLVDHGLARALERPCAETHLHVGAAVPFGVLWSGLARAVADRRDHRDLVARLARDFAGALPTGDASRALHLLRAASFARVTLAAFLRARERGESRALGAWCRGWLEGLAARVAWPWGARDAVSGWGELLRLLDAPGAPLTMAHDRARSLLREALGPAPAPTGDPRRDAVAHDPLGRWLGDASHPALPETRFAARALAYLLGDGARDDAFARCFWQYARVRGATFRALTQEAGVAGLHWFTRFYGRIGFFRAMLPRHEGEEASVLHALHTESRDLRLGALEVRTSPAPTAAQNRDYVRAVARQCLAFTPDTGGARPELGLVLHFIKSDDHRPQRVRHGAWFEAQRRCARALARMLDDHPELLLVLRGIDVANLEQAQPAWVLRPLFDLVRAASDRASRRLALARPAWRVPPLRATLHAGEDQLRLVEGVRRMHEALDFGLLRHGDRFGHGLAVGVDPAEEAGTTVAQARDERLDDLLWELDRYVRGDLEATASRVERVRHEALSLGRAIYTDRPDLDVEQLLAARRLRHDPAALARLRYPHVEAELAGPGAAWALVLAHLTDPGVHARGRGAVAVESREDERAMLAAAQRWLQRELARREVTVEANPSSNLRIGAMGDLGEHPALRLAPPQGADGASGVVAVSVNTDNPVTFGSCLADEFAYVYAALLGRGVGAREALAWIDARREDGWRSRFTLAASADLDALATVARAKVSPRRARGLL